MLKNIKRLIVRPRNPMVTIVELLQLGQGSEQPVQTISAEKKAPARQCNLKMKCTCNIMVFYSEHMVLHQLLFGLADDEIQEDLLALDTITPAKAEKLVMDREAEKRSQGSLQSDTAAALSNYKNNHKKPGTKNRKIAITAVMQLTQDLRVNGVQNARHTEIRVLVRRKIIFRAFPDEKVSLSKTALVALFNSMITLRVYHM